MTRSKALLLLGLNADANEQQIRKQFKRLAMKVHPDLNPDPSAHEQFVLLTEAMEIAMKPAVTENFPTKRESRRANKETDSSEVQKARMREAKERYENQRIFEEKGNQYYFEKLTTGAKGTIFKYIVFIGCLSGIMLLLELIFPTHQINDRLIAIGDRSYNGIFHNEIMKLQFQNIGNIFAQSNSNWQSMYPDCIIIKSWFTHIPTKMIQTDGFQTGITNFDFHWGSLRFLLIILFLIPLIPYFTQRKTLKFVLLYHFSFWISGTVLFYFLLSDFRILHLLSFGFL